MQSKLFNQEQIQWILDNHKGVEWRKFSRWFNQHWGTNFTHNQIHGFCQRNGITNGLDSRFLEGKIPHNKGRKQTEYMSEEAIERTKATRFHKGQNSHNKRPIGSERIDPRDGYVVVKVKDTADVHSTQNWMHKHRYVWEQAHGEIPEGHVVIMKDGSRTNFDLDNLVLVSRADHAVMNKLGLRYQGDFFESGHLMAKIIQEANK